MAATRAGASRAIADADISGPGTGESEGPAAPELAASPGQRDPRDIADLLDYIADMLEGMQGLARQTGDETLQALMKLAHAQARLEQGRLDPRQRS